MNYFHKQLDIFSLIILFKVPNLENNFVEHLKFSSIIYVIGFCITQKKFDSLNSAEMVLRILIFITLFILKIYNII